VVVAAAGLAPVVIVAVLLHRGHVRRMAEDQALLDAARREIAQLEEVKARIEEFQRKKKQYEDEIRLIESWRSKPGLRAIDVAKTAQSLGLVVEELSISGTDLTVTYRVPSPVKTDLFARSLEQAGIATQVAVVPGANGVFVLTAVILPPPAPTS
jgi:hypothetical protein